MRIVLRGCDPSPEAPGKVLVPLSMLCEVKVLIVPSFFSYERVLRGTAIGVTHVYPPLCILFVTIIAGSCGVRCTSQPRFSFSQRVPGAPEAGVGERQSGNGCLR